jgi:hypothetical protein
MHLHTRLFVFDATAPMGLGLDLGVHIREDSVSHTMTHHNLHVPLDG